MTGEPVEVSAEGDTVTFQVGEDEFKVEADGDEELVESSTRIRKSRRTRSVKASTAANRGRMVRRIKK